MSQLGSPAEIVSVFVSVMGEVTGNHGKSLQLQDALSVIFACAGDDDLSGLFGAIEPRKIVKEGTPVLVYRPARVPPDHILSLARCLLKHGIIGALPEQPKRTDDNYSTEFNSRDLVAVAMAHLGLAEREAWDMTMTGLAGALRSKFPPQESKEPGAKAPSKEEHEATMEWAARVEAKRRKRTLH